jgi:hypothetical protein
VHPPMQGRVMVAMALSALPGCPPGPPPVEVELVQGPVTLSPVPLAISAGEPLPTDNASVGVCIHPAPGYHVSGRWTVLTPGGEEAQVVARAELVNGDVVTMASPSSTGNSLCVHPRLGGPLGAAVKRIRVVASLPVGAQRIVWQCTGP